MLRKSQPNFQHYVKKIGTPAKNCMEQDSTKNRLAWMKKTMLFIT